MNQQLPPALLYGTLLQAFLFALPASVVACNQYWTRLPRDCLFEDADGQATAEQLVRFSSRLTKIALNVVSGLGLTTSAGFLIASLLLYDNDSNKRLAITAVATWSIILVHTTCITVHRSSIMSFCLGLWLMLSAFSFGGCSLWYSIWSSRLNHNRLYSSTVFWVTNTFLAFTTALLATLLPRRPDVSLNGRKVDGQRTVSALSRYTWSWVWPILSQASKQNDLEPSDIPLPDHTLRSQELKEKWDDLVTGAGLLRTLFRAYRQRLVLVWTVTFLRCLVSIIPFWTMLKIIRILEGRTEASFNRVGLLSLVVCLALSNLADAWLEGWGYWYSVSDLSLPIRAQLSAVIFSKSLRQKNITSEPETRHESSSGDDSDEDNTNANKGDETEDVKKAYNSRQDVMNLVGVDTERIIYFAQFQFMLVNGIFRIVAFSVFLGKLIGWVPFSAGVIAALLMMPLSTWLSYLLVGRSEKLMQLRDVKLSKISEAVSGIRQIKFSAMESKWEQRILSLRKMELAALWKYFVADTALFACSVLSPILWASTSLVVYVLMNGNLLPSVAFVSIGMFNTLETTLETLPELFMMGIDGLVAVRRINNYLGASELSDDILDGPNVQIKEATITWPTQGDTDKSTFLLRDINLSFPKGQLSVISGKSGEGKSLLAAAIIGEAELLKGSISAPRTPWTRHDSALQLENWVVPGLIAYVGQIPWLENASVRENILFGLPYAEARYEQVIEACALSHDLAQLPDKSETDLGPNGVNLSGGQKWRITLARAIYSRAETLVLEDVFSALDANVCRWILDKCLFGAICESRTRILVTHNTDLVLPKARYHVEIAHGTVKSTLLPDQESDSIERQDQKDTLDSDEHLSDPNETPTSNTSNRKLSTTARKFVPDETRNRGNVKRDVYLAYLESSGGILFCGASAFLFIAFEAGTIGRAWWLRIWTSQDADSNVRQGPLTALAHIPHIFPVQAAVKQPSVQEGSQDNVNYYLLVYIALSLSAGLVGILRYIWVYLMALKASKTIFGKLLFTTLHARLQFLDSVPAGRIINRFSADFNIIDQRIPLCWIMLLTNLLRLLGICAASFFASTYLLPPAAILLFIGAMVGKTYVTASRSLKRIESNAKSPIFELFGITLKGIMTIRAFQNTDIYVARMFDYLDAWTMSSYYTALANRWMSFRMALVAACFCVAVGVVITFNPSLDAALAGFALSFVLDFSESIRWTIRCHGELELDMNAMERVKEYMTLETEPLSGAKPPAAWPTSGRIDLDNLTVAYAPGLPPVLKGISLNIGHGERVGIVGRTGAGKSSLTLAIFRLIEMRSGGVFIDGLDISKIPIHDLRARIAIIPQDPVLFSGTIRFNLDPFEQHADDELFAALEYVHLKDKLPTNSGEVQTSDSKSSKEFFTDLSHTISASGGNLSQGQRQLFCIARAILARPKLLIFDEATSAVDVVADSLVQQSIRNSFRDTTLIVIAHRLNTVADFNRIVVLEDGSIKEEGTLQELLGIKGSFYEMYMHS